MKNRVLQNFVNCFVVFCLKIFVFTNLEAASPTYEPDPLRKESLMFEVSGTGIQQIKLDSRLKNSSFLTKQVLPKTIYREKTWQFDGQQFDIPIRETAKVKRIIWRLTSKQRKKMMKGIRRSGKYKPMIIRMLKNEGMPLDLLYMVPAESNFSVHSRSIKSAVGLWQFIASTGRLYGLKINRWIDERRDPVLSTKAAILYLKHLYGIFGDWELAMAAYNTGEGRVQRAIKFAKRKGKNTNYSSLRLPRETRNYVPAIMAMAIIYKNKRRYGLEHIKTLDPLDETKANLNVTFSLKEVAKRSKISFKQLRAMNPALFLGLPPMKQKRYSLYVPKKFHKNLMVSLGKNPAPSENWGLSYNALLSDSNNFTRILEKFGAPIYFRVQKGDNLWDLSRKHKTSIKRLSRWNKLNSKSVLRVNRRMKTYVPTWRVFKEISRNSSSLSTRLIAQRIRVPKGGVLSKIAERYRTSISKLMRWNKISSPDSIRAGQKLIVGYRKISNTKLPRVANVIRIPKDMTLSHLALRYKTTVKKLMNWNGLSNPKQLRVGMRFYVKKPPKRVLKKQNNSMVKTTGSMKKVRHKIIMVRNGDTLWGIARFYGTTVEILQKLNELDSSGYLHPDQKLVVPFRS